MVKTSFRPTGFGPTVQLGLHTGRNNDIAHLELILALPDNKESDWRVDPHRLIKRHVQIGQLLNALIVGMVIILKRLKTVVLKLHTSVLSSL